MEKMKRLTAILLAVALCFVFTACGGGTPATEAPAATSPLENASTPAPAATEAPADEPEVEEEPAGPATAREGVILTGDVIAAPAGAALADSVTIGTELPVTVLDALSSAATFTACCVQHNMIYDRLVYLTATGEYVGELATSWETEDWQNFTFYLRDDVTFHNGDKFTAQDVINTCEIAMSEAGAGSLATDVWRDVVNMTAVDDYTLEIELGLVSSSFIHKLSTTGGSIVSKAAREADPIEGAWVGTGAFMVDTLVSGDHSVLVRNDNYWGTAPLTKTVTFRYAPEIAARTVMQMNGEVDMSMSISPSDMDMFVEDPNYNVYGYAANSTHSLTMNMNDPIISDLNFRMAIAYALNRYDVAQAAGGNWNKVNQDGAFWGDSTPFRNTDLPEITQDLEKAREYLEASSYNGEEILFMCGPDTLTLSAQMVTEQLSQIGINVLLQPTDVPTLVGSTQYGANNMQLLHFVSPYTLDPTSARNMLYPNGSANRGSYNNPEVIALIDEAAATGDPKEQETLYKQIQELVYQDMPQISLYERIWTVVTSADMGGIVINADMYHDFRGVFKLA